MLSCTFEYEGKSYSIKKDDNSIIVSNENPDVGETHFVQFDLTGKFISSSCIVDNTAYFVGCPNLTHPEFWNIYQQFESQLIAATTEVLESVG